MASITLRQYNPDSGALLGNVSVLNFGRVTSGTNSNVIVFDIAFTEVTNVGNIKLGLISSGGLTVNASPIDIGTDGSAGNGYFGIEHTASFNGTKASGPLSRYFAGINSTVTSADSSNVSIGNRSDTLSEYIYINITVDSSSVGAGNGAYKIFFDFS